MASGIGTTAGMTMTTFELSLAILALLVTPGPTNTLMFLAGAERGLTRALRLIPAELAGYLLTVVPLVLAGAPLLQAHPGARAALALAAGLWVAVLALRLWRLPRTEGGRGTIGAAGVFTTTLLNPKALIFGLVLLPHPDHAAANIANFALQVVAVALLWQAGGAFLGRSTGPRMPVLRRAASLWLGGLSVMLVLRGVGVA